MPDLNKTCSFLTSVFMLWPRESGRGVSWMLLLGGCAGLSSASCCILAGCSAVVHGCGTNCFMCIQWSKRVPHCLGCSGRLNQKRSWSSDQQPLDFPGAFVPGQSFWWRAWIWAQTLLKRAKWTAMKALNHYNWLPKDSEQIFYGGVFIHILKEDHAFFKN